VPELALVLVLDEPRLEAIRERFYPDAVARGLPLHMTLLYPFGGDVEQAREAIAAHAPAHFALTRLGAFPGGFAVLLPEPQDELRALQRALWTRFPDWPPYAGEVDDPEPHATLARGAITPELEAAVAPLLPVAFRVDAVTVLEHERESERWSTRAQLALGRRGSGDDLGSC
jgi:2'-5' RNA ligase